MTSFESPSQALKHFALSLTILFGIFITTYGPAYYLVYCRPSTKLEFGKRKYNKDYPSQTLIKKEFRRCLQSVVVAALWDTLIAHLLPKTKLMNRTMFFPESYAWSAAYFLFMTAALFFWADFHFYFMHRSMHTPFLYKKIHKVHHESVNPDPWSGLSFHPVESVAYFSSLLIVFALPMPVWAFTIFRIALLVAPLGGHIGHDILGHSSIDHYIHHAKFCYNFGSDVLPVSPWDILLGTQYPNKVEHEYGSTREGGPVSADEGDGAVPNKED